MSVLEPSKRKPAALAGCYAAFSPCSCLKKAEITVCLLNDTNKGERRFVCAPQTVQTKLAALSSQDFLSGSLFLPLYPLSPLHSLKQGTQILDFKKPQLCC